jgi:integrase
MASVERHGDKWRVVWRDAGKKFRKSFTSETEAHRYKNGLAGQLEGAAALEAYEVFVEGKLTPTVADFGRDLIDNPQLKPNTRDMYATALRRVESSPLGGMRLGRVTASDLREFFRDLKKNRNNVRSVLAKVFNAAVREGVIQTSPLVQANVKPTERSQKDIRTLTVAEVERLAAAATTDRDALCIRIGAYVGLRAGEVGGLRDQDIDVKECRINVRRNASRPTGGVEFGAPKTKTSKRDLKVACSLVEDIARYIEAHPPLADGTLFYTDQGNPVTDQLLSRATVNAAASSDIPRLTFHDLRHTCASLLIKDKHEPKAIMRYLGHSSIRMTYDVYGHLFPKSDDPLAAGMEAAIQAARNGGAA